MIRVDGSNIYFSSGRMVYANDGIIGLSPELELSGGYDDRIYMQNGGFLDDESLSPAEAAELAAYMIGLWSKFQATVSAPALASPSDQPKPPPHT